MGLDVTARLCRQVSYCSHQRLDPVIPCLHHVTSYYALCVTREVCLQGLPSVVEKGKAFLKGEPDKEPKVAATGA